eukprot:gene17408-14195_t
MVMHMSPPHQDWKVIAIRDFKSDGVDEEAVKTGTIGTVSGELDDNHKYIKFDGMEKELLVKDGNLKRYLRWHEHHVGTVEKWSLGAKFGFALTDLGRLFVGKRDVDTDHLQHMCGRALIGFPEVEDTAKGPKAIGVKVLYKPIQLVDVKDEPGAGRGRGGGPAPWKVGDVKTVHRKYGFIHSDDDQVDYFFHRSKWEADVEPEPGMFVRFKVERGKGGPSQAGIVMLGGGHGTHGRPAGGRGAPAQVFAKPDKKEHHDAHPAGDAGHGGKEQQASGTGGKEQQATGTGSGCTNAAAARAGLLFVLEGIGQSVM